MYQKDLLLKVIISNSCNLIWQCNVNKGNILNIWRALCQNQRNPKARFSTCYDYMGYILYSPLCDVSLKNSYSSNVCAPKLRLPRKPCDYFVNQRHIHFIFGVLSCQRQCPICRYEEPWLSIWPKEQQDVVWFWVSNVEAPGHSSNPQTSKPLGCSTTKSTTAPH
jgi:hypothetical protein